MNFTFTWIMDKLGYMPKFNIEVGKVANFPVKKEVAEKQAKKKPTVQKATTRTKKTTTVAKKAKAKKV